MGGIKDMLKLIQTLSPICISPKRYVIYAKVFKYLNFLKGSDCLSSSIFKR